MIVNLSFRDPEIVIESDSDLAPKDENQLVYWGFRYDSVANQYTCIPISNIELLVKLKNYFDIKWLVLAVTFTATVIVLTHIPQRLMPSQMQESGVDKFLHFLAYGAITFLLILSVKSSPDL